jgi:hypothetical protein
MNEKLMKRLKHNAEKTQDPTIKALLEDCIRELTGTHVSQEVGMGSLEDLHDQLDAMEALTFEAINAVKNTQKGRLPTFMHQSIDKDGTYITIKLPGSRDTHVIRSRACIDKQKAHTSASASATEQSSDGNTSRPVVDGATDVKPS